MKFETLIMVGLAISITAGSVFGEESGASGGEISVIQRRLDALERSIENQAVSASAIANEKDRFERIGISFEAVFTGEYWANTRGGFEKDQTHLYNLDVTATLDTEQAGLWDDGKFFCHILSDGGGRMLTEEIVGDSQTVSNIEAPKATRLYELWYEQLFLNRRLSLLLGLHDYNAEFAVTEYGSLYINSSFGISRDISGGARPGIFPLAAAGARMKLVPNRAWGLMLGVYDGDPGDPGSDKRFLQRFDFDGKGGALIGFETAYHFAQDTLPGTVKAGFWNNTGKFEDCLDIDENGNPIKRKGNKGWYLIADKMLFREKEEQGLGAFLQLGWAPDDNINEFDSYVGAGLNYKGMIPHRDKDEAGIALAYASVSDKMVDVLGRDKAEATLEITYKAVVNEHIALQPDIQFVFNPGGDPTVEDAVVAGMRLEISL